MGTRAPAQTGIVLVEPMHVVRRGIAMLIESQPDMRLAAEAGTGGEALRAIRELKTHRRTIVVVGTGLQGREDSFWLIRAVREEFPSIAVVAAGGNPDDNTISRALFMGADGFLNKNLPPEDFLDALRQVRQGEIILRGVSPELLGPVADKLERQNRFGPFLTERELEVLSVAAEGLTSRQIGQRLGVRERTVTTHLERIYSKLGVNSRTAAISAAAQSGLVAVGARG